MSDFSRKIYGTLTQWHQKKDRKPLVIRGARQVGKTTLVKQFSGEFKYFISLNLESQAEQRYFQTGMDVERTIENISFAKHTPLNADTLLFIDEIQNEPQAIQMLRYFYEQHPEIRVISAGSLLENYTGRTFSFPVGRVEFVAMHPCTFYEFLTAIDATDDLQIIYDGKSEYIHDRLMRYFQIYTLLGGMPEVVKKYAETRDLRVVESIYQNLLLSYQDDVEKYAQTKLQAAIIRHILQYGWAYAGEIISYDRFAGSSYKSRDVSEAFLTLQKSMLLKTIYPTQSVVLPMQPQINRHPKLLWLDTGIVNYVAGIRDELYDSSDIQDVYRGRIAEHIVGQELIGLDCNISSQQSFWHKDKSEAEVDYLFLYESKLIPIEVKSGVNAHLKSLQQFMALASHDLAIRVWSKPFSVDDIVNPFSGKSFRLVNIPFYMVGMLPKVLSEVY